LLSSIRIGNVWDDAVPGPAASRSAVDCCYGTGTVRFTGWGDSLVFDLTGDGLIAQVSVLDQVRLLGAPPGSWPVTLDLRAQGAISGNAWPSPNDFGIDWRVGGNTILRWYHSAPCGFPSETCYAALNDSASVLVSFPADAPQTLEARVVLDGHGPG